MSNQIFISYAKEDRNFVRTLEKRLSKNYDVLTDQKILAGRAWKDEIDTMIKQSFAVVVVVTPRSNESKYVIYEWAYALGLGRMVIPLLLEQLENMHPILKDLQWIPFMDHFDPPWDELDKPLKAAHDSFRNAVGTDEAMRLLADAKEKQAKGDHLNALATLEASLTFAPDHQKDDIHYAIGRSHWELALSHRALKAHEQADAHLEQAEVHLDEALHYNSQHAYAMVLEGELQRLRADDETDDDRRESLLSKAEERFRTALDLQPAIRDLHGESVRASLGGTLRRRKLIGKAIEEYKKAAAITSTSYPYNTLGLLYMHEKDPDNMRKMFRLVRRSVGNKIGQQDFIDAWTYNDLLVSQIVLEDLDDAAETLEMLLAVPPSEALQSLLATLEDTMRDLPGASPEALAFIARAVQAIKAQIGTAM